jgi:hypothetical protein
MAGNEGFRQTEIKFLQEQNQQVIDALEKVEGEKTEAVKIAAEFQQKEASLQAEYDRVKLKIAAITTDLQQQRSEAHSKDEPSACWGTRTSSCWTCSRIPRTGCARHKSLRRSSTVRSSG